MLGLCLFALIALGVETVGHVDQATIKILEYADVLLCGFFLLDFFVNLARAPRKRRYLLTWGWIDLASSIPAFGVLRLGRLARVVRILRVLRGFRATKLLAGFVLEHRAEGAFLAAALVSILLVCLSSIAVLQFESVPAANIKTAEDALWWAMTTITTVGYGDRYPVTAEGRVVAGLLMTAGVGLIGVISGSVASWFLAHSRERAVSELELIRLEVAKLRESLEAPDSKID